ncbi:MAG: class I SAM-dependent methyltransferase [Syntrophobacteraceae bacterium]|nr:class I SAM-dependent methyltransferase [Syntrophobacteraceae bacterium]
MWQQWKDRLKRSRWVFEWRYWRGRAPWDTQITPPEVMAFLAEHSPGTALDLGCGTGTNAMALARHGWKVTGVDFAPRAIRMARRKAAAAGLEIEFHTADVSSLSVLKGPYDYVLDIGCLFVLGREERRRYAEGLARLAAPGGWYMLYAWLPRPWQGGVWGMAPEEVEALLGGHFSRIRLVVGTEKGHPTAWYWYRKR